MVHPLLADKETGFLLIDNISDHECLLEYYRFGVFPWSNHGQQGFFYFPYYRYIIEPTKIKIAKSIRSYFNQKKYRVTADTCFDAVIENCSKVARKDQADTWISSHFRKVYTKLYDLGYAHSIEVWEGDQLVGGLYGVAIGRVFTGESMFSLKSNASRFGLISLAKKLEELDFDLIDCQIENPYLSSFGGENLQREYFLQIMQLNVLAPDLVGKWTKYFK